MKRRREAAIAALLAHPTVTAAARAAGVGERTLGRWLGEPGFVADVRTAREQTIRIAVGRLHGLLAKATTTLERAMDGGVTAVPVKAAVATFDLALRGRRAGRRRATLRRDAGTAGPPPRRDRSARAARARMERQRQREAGAAMKHWRDKGERLAREIAQADRRVDGSDLVVRLRAEEKRRAAMCSVLQDLIALTADCSPEETREVAAALRAMDD